MHRFRFTAPNFALALAALASSGCFGDDPFGLDGDWSNGERNNTQWQISDGLCPGLSGGCALNVPIAVGVQTSFTIEGVRSGSPTVNTPANMRSVTINANPENQRAFVSFTTSAPGSARFVISDENGEVDAANIQVRQATRIECGVITTETEPRWDIGGFTIDDAATVPMEPATTTAQMHSLACRTSDDAGALLSAGAIQWTILEGSAVALNDDDLNGATIRGAHIRYTTLSRGSVQVRATLGELTDTFSLTVE